MGGLAAEDPARAADEEIAPEVKALISRFNDDLKSKSSTVRISAYKSMGELGPKAASVRRQLCQGHMDPVLTVQAAAADALKKVDEPMSKLALAIYINKDFQEVAAAAKLGKGGEPLTPLVLKLATETALVASFAEIPGEPFGSPRNLARRNLSTCVQTLVLIAPEDPGVNTAIINMLANPSAQLRYAAVQNISPLKNQKLALAGILKLASNLREESRIREGSVLSVPSLVDENTAPGAIKALEALQFDTDPKIRDAVDSALKQMAK
jgi:HEAT repeat protein